MKCDIQLNEPRRSDYIIWSDEVSGFIGVRSSEAGPYFSRFWYIQRYNVKQVLRSHKLAISAIVNLRASSSAVINLVERWI